jgi:positive regulator of sigma E activity
MKTKLFLKHFGNNIMQIGILFVVMALCGVAAYYIFGVDPIFGLLAFLFAMLGYFTVQRSLEQATRDLNNDF